MNRLVLFLLLAFVNASSGALNIKPLSKEEVRNELIGREISDGYHWEYWLKKDGTIQAVEMGRARTGAWHFDGRKLCIAIKNGGAPNQCWDVMREGKKLVFGIDGQVIYDINVRSRPQGFKHF